MIGGSSPAYPSLSFPSHPPKKYNNASPSEPSAIAIPLCAWNFSGPFTPAQFLFLFQGPSPDSGVPEEIIEEGKRGKKFERNALIFVECAPQLSRSCEGKRRRPSIFLSLSLFLSETEEPSPIHPISKKMQITNPQVRNLYTLKKKEKAN